jgi:hypothetical protein
LTSLPGAALSARVGEAPRRIRFRPRVEALEGRCVPAGPVNPLQTTFLPGRPGSGLLATVADPDGDADVDQGYTATLTYTDGNATNTIPVQVALRSDGQINIFGTVTFRTAGTISATVNFTEMEEDGNPPETVTVDTSIYVCPSAQANYADAPANVRTKLTQAGYPAWRREAVRLAAEMSAILGPGQPFALTSIIKPGPHSKFKKMDVAVRGDTSWEELAYAASQAGFWVHGEGVNLCGTDWPLSPLATGAHLDLYLERK